LAEGVSVLRSVEALLSDVRFDLVEHAVGAGEFLRSGHPLPPATLDRIREADAILRGATGLPSVCWPNGVEMTRQIDLREQLDLFNGANAWTKNRGTPQIDLREQLDLFNGVRPIQLFDESHTPLKGDGGAKGRPIDFVIIRENCDGLFSERLTPRPPGRDFETDTLKITRRGAERVCREAFQLAIKRRKHCTPVDQANVLPSVAFFRKIFDEGARDFPTVTTDLVYVDAMALFMVQRPESFDVMVTENMCSDILSDLGAGLIGGMGMAPSADVGDTYGLFQPAHGAALTMAGKGIANPIATILSVAMMLEWLDHSETLRGARTITDAVTRVLDNPDHRTADLGGKISTTPMGNFVCQALI
jgi:3-isopropylmalate dehydrogenase